MKASFDTISYSMSKAITNHYSTSFSMGIKLLHSSIRKDIYNIYGFVRLADEIVDSFHAYNKASMLSDLRVETVKAIEAGISINPVLNSFQYTVNRYAIPFELIDSFLQSMESDLRKSTYNREEYNSYIFGSAEVVGLMCLKVFCNGCADEYGKLKPYAQKLGSAFQKINFLRDVQADLECLGRHYLPAVDLKYLTEAEKRLIEDEIEAEFDEALKGIKQLPVNCRAGVYTAYVYYRQLLKRIRKVPATEICRRRVRISNYEKLSLLFYNQFLMRL